ncbi:hypothetical protein BDV41DRAFT_145516 [Aspergillus transmontanensis]|uniref:Uncharacterized protein n=1 Tax=Aspergillus transmontanensis TaxID=1034304 RepID=A0A5N6W5E0_9EURO|nr:hypothetical protein BDV41DRAFT_145516 [Aspergillus transmontanensis]
MRRGNHHSMPDESRVTDVQELLSYHKHIRDFWYAVFGGNEGDVHRLDAASVRALELKAPGASNGEARGLYGRVCAGEILSAFSGEQRQAIWSRIRAATVDCLVPSLSGFFDDLKHLKLVADSVKWLVRLERRETIWSALEYSFSDADHGNNLCLAQTSSSSFRSVSGSDIDWFDVAYRVLWLCALREYLEMPAEPKKKLAGPRSGQVNEKVLFEFASLAHKLGFRSERIQDLLQRDPDREIARRLLLTARKSDRFRYHDLERCVTGVTELMKSA